MNSKEKFINSFRNAKLHGNFILDLNPFTKLNCAFAIFLGAALLGHYWTRLAVIIICYVINALSGKENFKRFVKLYSFVAFLFFFFLIGLNTCFRPGETLYWEWGIIGITKEGFFYGLSMALLINEICGSIMSFYMVTPMKDIMYSVERLGAPRAASYIMLASMQSIIDLGKSANTIMESQSARGVETSGNLKTRAKAFVPILFPLFLGAIAGTEEKTVAMETRAFSANRKPTHMYELRKTPALEKVFCVFLDLVVIISVVWRFLP
ncbi:MAG: energy-coupling factor transporter transmembrane component T [Lachnospiraceae bacterium]|nr:energy-coupling factor transporter transmembrane component T [Lachnospiraceae bacterium]